MNTTKLSKALLWGLFLNAPILDLNGAPITLRSLRDFDRFIQSATGSRTTFNEIHILDLFSKAPEEAVLSQHDNLAACARATITDDLESHTASAITDSIKSRVQNVLVLDVDDTLLHIISPYFNWPVFTAFKEKFGENFNTWLLRTANELLPSLGFNGYSLTHYTNLDGSKLSIPLKNITDFETFFYSAVTYLTEGIKVELTHPDWPAFIRAYTNRKDVDNKILFVSAAHPAHVTQRVALLKSLGIELGNAIGRQIKEEESLVWNAQSVQGEKLFTIVDNVVHTFVWPEQKNTGLTTAIAEQKTALTKATVIQNILSNEKATNLFALDDSITHLEAIQDAYSKAANTDVTQTLPHNFVFKKAPNKYTDDFYKTWGNNEWTAFKEYWINMLKSILPEYISYHREHLKLDPFKTMTDCLRPMIELAALVKDGILTGRASSGSLLPYSDVNNLGPLALAAEPRGYFEPNSSQNSSKRTSPGAGGSARGITLSSSQESTPREGSVISANNSPALKPQTTPPENTLAATQSSTPESSRGTVLESSTTTLPRVSNPKNSGRAESSESSTPTSSPDISPKMSSQPTSKHPSTDTELPQAVITNDEESPLTPPINSSRNSATSETPRSVEEPTDSQTSTTSQYPGNSSTASSIVSTQNTPPVSQAIAATTQINT